MGESYELTVERKRICVLFTSVKIEDSCRSGNDIVEIVAHVGKCGNGFSAPKREVRYDSVNSLVYFLGIVLISMIALHHLLFLVVIIARHVHLTSNGVPSALRGFDERL